MNLNSHLAALSPLWELDLLGVEISADIKNDISLETKLKLPYSVEVTIYTCLDEEPDQKHLIWVTVDGDLCVSSAMTVEALKEHLSNIIEKLKNRMEYDTVHKKT